MNHELPFLSQQQFFVLTSDLERCQENLDSEDSQFWRRTYIRTAFAFIEAMNGILRVTALRAATSNEKTELRLTRIALLDETGFSIQKNGTLKEEDQRHPFLNYTAFILRSLAEESYGEASFFGDNGWNELQKAVQIRHRLTHPKGGSDMNISDEELTGVHEAMRWYHNAVVSCMSNGDYWDNL